MINSSVDYNDMLEGDALACRPGNVAPGLEYICEYYLPLLGAAALLNGISFFSLFVQGRRLQRSIAMQTGGTTTPGNARECGKRFSHSEKVILSLGALCVSYGINLFTNGWGTMYSTQHIRGQIGDFIGEYEALVL
jgi:hypothetical protein